MIPRALLAALLSLPLVSPALAQQAPTSPPKKKPVAVAPRTAAPKAIGTFDDWIAATHQEAGQPVCYAFTRAQSSMPAVAGRGAVILTVTPVSYTHLDVYKRQTRTGGSLARVQ